MTLTNKMAVKKVLIAFAIAGISQAYAAPPVTNYEYDANGNNTKVIDGLSNATTQQYDAVDRLIKQSQPHPTSTGQLGQINQTYNALDALTGVTDPRSLATTYTKDAYGRVLTQTSPDTGTTTYTYDNAGNVLTKTDARGKVMTYTYDALNRLISTSGGNNYTYTYDQGTTGKGRLTSVSQGTASPIQWTYDAQGHVTRKQTLIQSTSFDLQMQYDSAGRLSRLIYPSARYIDYGYNTNGQINQISVDGTVMLSSIQYHPNGIVKGWTWANGQPYQRTLDSSGRITSCRLGDQVQNLSYDNAGRITQSYRALATTPTTPLSGTSITYSYDNLDRLTAQVTDSSNTGYQYDLNGNRTQLTLGANNYAYTIDANSNKLLSEAGPVAKTYHYDAAGNTTNDDALGYTYYNDGRLYRVGPSDATYTSSYNGLGQRHSLHSNRYIYDESGHLIGEYAYNGDLNQETVYLGDTPVLTLRSSALQVTADNTSTTGAGTAAVVGTWTTATSVNGFYGFNYHTHAAAASTTDKFVYTITPAATQSYRIYARWQALAGNATNATYTIAPNTAGSTPTTITVDQTQNGSAWNYLGTYSLNTANQLTISLSGQGDGVVIADAVRVMPAATESTQDSTYFVYTDHLNTPRLITNYSNQKRWTWYPETSEAFGANLPNENPDSVGVFTYNLRFPGQLYFAPTQLVYNYYRDYNPRTGRYIESDPIGLDAGQMSTYTYVNANPLSFSDVFGLVKHTTGRTISCGKCTIRIDYTFDEKTGAKRNHLHWNCKGKEGSCGENGEESHGGTWEDAPENVKQCARDNGFQGDSSPNASPKVQLTPLPWWAPLLLPAAGAVLSQ